MEIRDIFLGNDLVEVSRVLSSINKFGKRFTDRIYTKHEQIYCGSKPKPELHYAGRFAAKEAAIKALKASGFKHSISFLSIDIRTAEDGQPIVFLDLPINGACRVSISHTDNHAIACAIFMVK